MPDLPNVLPASGQTLPESEIALPVDALDSGDFSRAWEAFSKMANDARASGDEPFALVYASLSIVASPLPNYSDPLEPYSPLSRGDGKRSVLPSDLSPDDIVTLTTLRPRMSHPLMRARMGDFAWLRSKDPAAATAASTDYLAAASSLLTPERWIYAIPLFARALQMASPLGRKNDLWKAAESAFLAAIDHPLAATQPFYVSKFLSVALPLRVGDPAVLGALARRHADNALGEGDHRRAQIYLWKEAALRRLAKDQTAEAAARLEAARLFEPLADACLQRAQPSHRAASEFLRKGIEALRRLGETPAAVSRLRTKLDRYRRTSGSEWRTEHIALNVDEMATAAVGIIQGRRFPDALQTLAFLEPLLTPTTIAESLERQAQVAPFSYFVGVNIDDSAGRVQSRIEPPSLSEETAKQAKAPEAPAEPIEVTPKGFHHAATVLWTLRAAGLIEPGRRQIWAEHHPQLHDLAGLVFDNPFVPPGHEAFYLRGLFYGLSGDFLLASVLFAPQIENSVRYVLEQRDVDVSNLDGDLTEPVKTWGPLLALPETKEIFGEGYCTEFRGLLLERTGYAFRHDVAHGFVTEGQAHGPGAQNVWWLALRLCFEFFDGSNTRPAAPSP